MMKEKVRDRTQTFNICFTGIQKERRKQVEEKQ